MGACATRRFVEGCDRSSLLPLVACKGTLGCDDIYIKSSSSNDIFNTDLNGNNPSNPSLIFFLASDQFRPPKHGHRKFIPEQLRLREWFPTDPVGQDSCKMVSQIFQSNTNSPGDPELDLSVDKRQARYQLWKAVRFKLWVRETSLPHLEFAFATKKHQSKVIHWTGFPSIKFLRMPAGRLVDRYGGGGCETYIRVK